VELIRVNLIPKKPGMKMPKIPIGTILGIIILVAVGYGLWGVVAPGFDSKLDDLRAQKSRLIKEKKIKAKRKQQQLDEINNQIASIENKINMIDGLISTDHIVAWTDIMERLTEVVPRKKVWLTRFNTEPNYQVNIFGKSVDTVKNISQFLDNLKKDAYFSNIYLQKAIKNKVSQQEIWDFSLKCQLKKRSE
jgi:hypothetical protein